MGRWINRDPTGEEGGVNLYLCAINSLPNNIDYLGLLDWKSLINSTLSITLPLPWFDFTISLTGSNIKAFKSKCCFDVTLSGTFSRGINLKKYLTMVKSSLIVEVGVTVGGVITLCKEGSNWEFVEPIGFITAFGQLSIGGSRTYHDREENWGGFRDPNYSGFHVPIKKTEVPGFFATAKIEGTFAWNFSKSETDLARSGIFATLQGGVHIGWFKWSYDVPNWKMYP